MDYVLVAAGGFVIFRSRVQAPQGGVTPAATEEYAAGLMGLTDTLLSDPRALFPCVFGR
ncbi:hypothetical protein GCM10010339_83870 [Streptomyces alanosinicus]|uniref:Uncharacterized protein n=1 Tax=Streptomyces alanosinicus TaxID=68171 RepID=A0A918YS74_9ACTN|nr:hypothetical protein GCM10010339_83870 [Streptomyces alanosinicus]